jgi:hypothetical protein
METLGKLTPPWVLYFRWKTNSVKEASLLSLVKMILPLGSSYRYIIQVLDQLKVRQVNSGKALNAFGYSVRTILRVGSLLRFAEG